MKYAAALAAGSLLAGSLLLPSAVTGQQDAARPQPQDIGVQPGHLPKVHYVPSNAAYTKYPIWVDASMVFNQDGRVNTTLLPVEGVRTVTALLQKAPTHGCVPVGTYFEDIANLPERNSIEQATKNSRLVVLGKVTENAYGISGYIPGQLLRVVPEEVIKGQPRDVAAYFVFVPVGYFKLGSVTLCKTDSRYPEVPKVGDQVLLFVPDAPNWQADQKEPYLELQDDGGIVTIHGDSTVSLPKRFLRAGDTKAPLSVRDVLSRVRAAGKEGN